MFWNIYLGIFIDYITFKNNINYKFEYIVSGLGRLNK
jgi:hypothetical protein